MVPTIDIFLCKKMKHFVIVILTIFKIHIQRYSKIVKKIQITKKQLLYPIDIHNVQYITIYKYRAAVGIFDPFQFSYPKLKPDRAHKHPPSTIEYHPHS